MVLARYIHSGKIGITFAVVQGHLRFYRISSNGFSLIHPHRQNRVILDFTGFYKRYRELQCKGTTSLKRKY